MKISLFRNGYANTTTAETIEDWDSFCDLVMTPVIGTKNGDYFVRGFCDGPRADLNMVSMDLIIIDGDQLLTDGSSCCPPEPVHQLMMNHGLTHVIYTSFSNDIINSRHKWRLCVPCEELTDGNALIQGVSEIIGVMHSVGLPVRNVMENNTISQPWFTPRCANENAVEDFYARFYDGKYYKLGTFRAAKPNSDIATPSESKNGQFSWKYIRELYRSGTLHTGIRAAAGWLVRTTDWSESQIVDYLSETIDICPDLAKINRARANNCKEITELVKFCKKKSGIIIADQSIGWKASHITAAELRNKEFPPVQWAVEGLIPEGLTILAGDEKFGKSLMAIDLCLGVATGTHFMGSRECKKGDAYYISLEDPEQRVKTRILQQRDDWPDTFHMSTSVEGPDIKTLVEVFDDIVINYPNTRLIVVDVLNHVTPENQKSTISDYQFTNKFLQPLQKWSNSNHIALVMITHKRKELISNGDNPFNGIMGSKAIASAADTLIMVAINYAKKDMLKNDQTLPDGFLYLKGREMGREDFALEFDAEALKWVFAHEKQIKEIGNLNWLMITDSLKTQKRTRKEISEVTKINRATVKTCVGRMKKKGLLEEDQDGKIYIPDHKYNKPNADRW
jgi:hypothetical protein